MDCLECGQPIDPARVARAHRLKYCSATCNNRAYRARGGKPFFEPSMKVCEQCGQQFLARSAYAQFCGQQCGKLNYREADRRVRASVRAATLLPRPCVICGGSFEPKRADSRHCSKRCRDLESLSKKNEGKRARRLATIRRCPLCDSAFSPTATMVQRYCSPECRDRMGSIRQTLRRFGLSNEEYGALYRGQGGSCAICRIPEAEASRRLAIDHDHSCCDTSRGDPEGSCGKCVRGLLCTVCNLSLGRYEASGYLPASFADYVDSYRKTQQRRSA